MKNIRVKLTFTESLLGTSPANEEIYRDFVARKSPDAKTVEEEVAALGEDAVVEKGMTVFPKAKDGTPFFYDYQVKGFFKGACGFLRSVEKTKSSAIKAYKKKIDGLIFVAPRVIPIRFAGEIGVCQRPLRAQTLQGERVTLAISEEIPAGASCEFEVTCLSDSDADTVREWLDFGKLSGLGQWRNSGHGRFVWEERSESGAVIGGNAAQYFAAE